MKKVPKNWPLFVALLTLIVVSWGFTSSGWYTAKDAEWDWDFYWAAREIIRRIWMSGGSLHPWVAHLCGGFPLLDSTEMPLLSPFLPLWQAIGAVPGTKWEFVITLGLGLIGMYQAAGAIAPRSPLWVRACAAFQFATCGFLLMHLNAGHISFGPFALFSWILYGYAARRVEAIALALAAGPILGANNYFMHAILFTGVLGLTRRDWLPLMIRGGLWAGALGAPILGYTLLEYRNASYLKFTAFNHHELPRTVTDLFGLLTSDSTQIWKCDVDCYWEYGNHIGAAALVIGLVGLGIGTWRRAPTLRSWAIVGGVFFLIALGPFADWAPFKMLWHLPLFSRLEVNTRFLFGFVAALFAGWAWLMGEAASRAGKDRLKQTGVIVLAAASVIPSVVYAKQMFDRPGRGRPLPDLRGISQLQMNEMSNPSDWHAGRYDTLAGQKGEAWCHVSSSKHNYPGKTVLNKGPLLEAPAGSSARLEGDEWVIDWTPSPEALAKGPPFTWLFNQNYSKDFVVSSAGAPERRFATDDPDDLLRVTLADASGLAPGKPESIRIAQKAPRPLVAAYGIFIAAWAIFLARLFFGAGGPTPFPRSSARGRSGASTGSAAPGPRPKKARRPGRASAPG